MKLHFSFCLVVGLLTASDGLAQKQKGPRPRQGDLKVGDLAPDFTVKDVDGKKSVTLSKLKGKPVVLIFGSCT
jgi:cytochrome oxidase Cu insertion factor (SCO1/SenC/PrrC family)